MLTDKGFDHLNEVMNEHYGITMTREVFDRYEDEFVDGVDTSFGFYDEANEGALSDTLPRELMGFVLAQIFTDHTDWPCNGDEPSIHKDFFKQYIANINAMDGVTLRADL